MQTHTDDLYFQQQTIGEIAAWLNQRYRTWSSRVVIECVLVICLQLPRLVWHCLDLAVLLLLAVSSVNLLAGDAAEDTRRAARWLVVINILIYRTVEMGSAGWTATSMNYLWPLAFGVFFLGSFAKILRGERIPFRMVLLYIPALIFTANLEQAACLLLGFTVCFIPYCIHKKRNPAWLMLTLLIVAVSLAVILLCPGNGARFLSEVNSWFPGYDTYSLLHRLRLGLGVTMDDLFFKFRPNSLLFLLTLSVLGCCKAQNWQQKTAALFPLVFSAWLMLLPVLGIEPHPFAFPLEKRDLDALLCTVVYGFAVLGILYDIALIFGKTHKTLLMWIIFAAGCCSRTMMGFSPTVYASSKRTGIFLTYAVSYIAISAALSFWEARRSEEGALLLQKDAPKVAICTSVLMLVLQNVIEVF